MREYPINFGMKFVRMLPALRTGGGGQPILDKKSVAALDAKAIFESMKFDDLWEDAEMVEVLQYLKGNSGLEIPEEWKNVLPTKL